MAEKGVKLLGMWASPFAVRVEWALVLKGIEYEYVSEDLHHKSPELLKYNPVHKKVPVLVHDGKPICESLIIIEYIEETWKGTGISLLPEDPCERATARFWAKFVEDKIVPCILSTLSKLGEEQKKAVEELQESLCIIAGALEGKKFFGGETIGLVDLALGSAPYWLSIFKEVTGATVALDGKLEVLKAWSEEFLAVEAVKGKLPPHDKLLEFFKKYRDDMIAA